MQDVNSEVNEIEDEEHVDASTLAQELQQPQPNELTRFDCLGGIVVVCREGVDELCVAFANPEFYIHFHMKQLRTAYAYEIQRDVEAVIQQTYQQKSLQVYANWGIDGRTLH